MTVAKFQKLVTVGISESSLDVQTWAGLRTLCEQLVTVKTNDPNVDSEISTADGLLLAWGVTCTKEQMDQSPQLKFIGILATAYGTVDVTHAKEKGIVVTNVPGYSTESVAEMVFAFLLMHTMQLEEARRRAKLGDLDPDGYRTSEIKGKIFGVIGLGDIGTRVAEIAAGFGADVRYWSKHRKQEKEHAALRYSEINELIPSADILSLHLAGNTETENFLNAARLASIKTGAIVVNTAPMELIDLAALQSCLEKGTFTFITDHMETFTKEQRAPFEKLPNCILIPSVGFQSNEARAAKQRIFLENVTSFLNGSPVRVVG